MTIQEKLAILEDIMELDEGQLNVSDTLADYDEWDSIAMLSFVAMMDEQFHKIVKGSDVKSFVTVQDAINIME